MRNFVLENIHSAMLRFLIGNVTMVGFFSSTKLFFEKRLMCKIM